MGGLQREGKKIDIIKWGSQDTLKYVEISFFSRSNGSYMAVLLLSRLISYIYITYTGKMLHVLFNSLTID